ncbi:MAG: non-canonical purine NTP pyrophosphatase [Acidobacteriota bacterium]
MKLLIATSNAGKAREIETAFIGLPIEVAKLGDLKLSGIEETGLTFAENARQKALHYARQSGLVTLADDSGLEVDLLDGRPGVFSNRYGRDDNERIARLLAELRTSGQWPVVSGQTSRRSAVASAAPTYAPCLLTFLSSARFVCAVCVAGDQVLFTTERRCEGAILDHPVPGGGFGYDPVFYSIEAGAALSSLSVEEKNAVSHRGKALAEVRRWIGGLWTKD